MQFGIHTDDCAGTRLNRKQGRVIERYLTADYSEANQQRIKDNKDYYRRRQSIVEHPFGTIKRQWGYSYTLVKGLEKVGGEFDLICLCYNMRRSVSILGVKALIERLKACFFGICTIFATAREIMAQVLIKYWANFTLHSASCHRGVFQKDINEQSDVRVSYTAVH